MSEEDFTSFYQFLTSNSYDKPRYRSSFATDSPINLRALLFVPSMKPNIFDQAKELESSVSLYSRKVSPRFTSDSSDCVAHTRSTFYPSFKYDWLWLEVYSGNLNNSSITWCVMRLKRKIILKKLLQLVQNNIPVSSFMWLSVYQKTWPFCQCSKHTWRIWWPIYWVISPNAKSLLCSLN